MTSYKIDATTWPRFGRPDLHFIETLDRVDIYRDLRDGDLLLRWGEDMSEISFCRVKDDGNLDVGRERDGSSIKELTPLIKCRLYELYEGYNTTKENQDDV